jgi:hypothetical protein
VSAGPWVDVLTDVATLRYVLVALGVAWAAVTARWGVRSGLVVGVLFVEAAFLFWVSGLGRPYGLFVDFETTRWLADLMVGAAAPALREGAVAGEPASSTGVGVWLRLGLSPQTLRWLPNGLPLVTAVAPGLLVAALWRDAVAPLGAVLCLAFATGELDTLAGVGFWPGLWARPGTSVLLIALLALVVLADRLLPGPRARFVACAGIAACWILVPSAGADRGLGATLLLLTGDQGVWLWPGLWGLVRGGRPLPRALCASGAALSLLSGVGLAVDPWGAHALFRIGLLLAAATSLADLVSAVGPRLALEAAALRARWPGLARAWGEPDPRALAAGVLLLATVPTSFLVQWNARRHDAVYEASLSPVSAPVVAAMTWIREHTSPEATFVVGRAYAVAIPTLGERRVLRAPGFPTPGGERGRTRLEGGILHGRDVVDWVRMYRVRYVFVAPSDFLERNLERPEDVGRAGLRLVYENDEGMRIYEVPPPH